jgi:nicotinic acetylcholine receptor, invertebrate
MIGQFYGVSMMIISLASTCTVFTLNIFYKGEECKPVPPIMQLIFFRLIGRIVFVSLFKNFNYFINKIGFVFKLTDISKRHKKDTTDIEIVEKNYNENFDSVTVLGKHVFYKRNYSLKNEKIIKNEKSISNLQLNHLKLIKLISKLNENFAKREIRLAEEEMNEKIKKQWILLSNVIDRLLLYVFLFVTFFVLGGIINQAPNAKFI